MTWDITSIGSRSDLLGSYVMNKQNMITAYAAFQSHFVHREYQFTTPYVTQLHKLTSGKLQPELLNILDHFGSPAAAPFLSEYHLSIFICMPWTVIGTQHNKFSECMHYSKV